MVLPHLGDAPEWMRRSMARRKPQASATCELPSPGRGREAVARLRHWSRCSRVQRTAAAPEAPSLVPPSKETCTAGPLSLPLMWGALGTVISSPIANRREAVREAT
eukprot:6088037-Heterocapsa_arctica.AAC.1